MPSLPPEQPKAATSTGKNQGGRPEHRPTDKLRSTARAMARVGVNHNDIAHRLGIAPKTLRKHYKPELLDGAIDANEQVLGTLYQMATSGNCPAATIFWVRTRCGFKIDNSPKSMAEEFEAAVAADEKKEAEPSPTAPTEPPAPKPPIRIKEFEAYDQALAALNARRAEQLKTSSTTNAKEEEEDAGRNNDPPLSFP